MAQIQIDYSRASVHVVCIGRWRATELKSVAVALSDEVALLEEKSVIFDLSGIETLDTAGALLLQRTERGMSAAGCQVQYVGADDRVKRILSMTQRYGHTDATFAAYSPGILETIGRRTEDFFEEVRDILAFFGHTFFSFVGTLFRHRRFRIRELAYQMMESAVKALGIIALTMFLVGVVVAYQSSVQLKTYGANIFIVDALGISILRELAPMLTAIIVAGRSGSSFAAQIGVMKMTEEIDAMRTMGFGPYTFLVLPRMLALIIMMPILIFFADLFGVLGGMVIANTELGLSTTLFLDRFVEAVPLKHFWVGLIKGPFFGVLIASIGIYRGLQVKNDTESIGINTTKSVVEAIFAVIICDALFSIVFTKLGF